MISKTIQYTFQQKISHLEVESFAFLTHALFSCAKRTKVFGGFGYSVTKQAENNSSSVIGSGNFDIKVNLGSDLFEITGHVEGQ